jgi:hypothetical protein
MDHERGCISSTLTPISLALATEARRSGITVSADAEKDRNIASQYGLLELATTIFMNSFAIVSRLR